MTESGLGKLAAAHLLPLVSYRAPEERGTNWVRLDANECALPLPEYAKSLLAAAAATANLARYPDGSCRELAALVAKAHGGAADDYLFGAGSDELITILLDTFSAPRAPQQRAKVLLCHPSFVMYRLSALAHGHDPVEVPLRADFQLDVPKIQEALHTVRPNLLFIASPNNPTGAAFATEDLEAVLRAAKDCLVVLDGAYEPFHQPILHGLADRFSNAAVLGTISKVGFAGLRVGWARLPSDLVEHAHKVRQPFNVSTVSQRMASVVLRDLRPLIDAHVIHIQQERRRMLSALTAIEGISPYPSEANFILCQTRNAEAVCGGLWRRKIAIKNLHGNGPPLEEHVRITLGTTEEHDALLAALGEDTPR